MPFQKRIVPTPEFMRAIEESAVWLLALSHTMCGGMARSPLYISKPNEEDRALVESLRDIIQKKGR